MISISNVSKKFGSRQVINNINFQISEGQIIGLLGPNGAGKTTTLRMIAGVLPPSSGTITINGKDPIENVNTRQTIGYLPENNPLYNDMTVEEWLKYWHNIRHSDKTNKEIKQVIKKTGLQSVYYRLISELSKGFKQRVGLAQAMLGNPKILLLDEPSEGLDPNQRKEIQKLVKELGSKRTVIISSHVLSEITKMCNRLIILHQGQIVADGTPHELTSTSTNHQIIQAELKGKNIITELNKLPEVKKVSKKINNQYLIKTQSKKDIRLKIFKLAKSKNWELYELTQKQIELEDVFSKLTR